MYLVLESESKWGRFYHRMFRQYEILVLRFFCFKELTLETPLWLVSNLTHR